MSTYVPDSYLVFETAHNLTELIDQLLERVATAKGRIPPQTLEGAVQLLERIGATAEDVQFIKTIAGRLRSERKPRIEWEDLGYAVRLLSQTEYRLKQLVAAEESTEPVPQARERFDELATAFQIAERPIERRSRLARTKLIQVTLTKRPGLYVTELYRELSQFGHMKVTYPTIWSDVRTMEKERALLTVGGPQGTPRYCFVHPEKIKSRRLYYNNFYGTDGTVVDRLTDDFEPTKRFVDVFKLNSATRPLLLVVNYGVAKADILGQKVKTFGKLHQHRYLSEREGLQSVKNTDRADVLRVLNLTTIQDQQEQLIWYDHEALAGLSLYSGKTTVGM